MPLLAAAPPAAAAALGLRAALLHGARSLPLPPSHAGRRPALRALAAALAAPQSPSSSWLTPHPRAMSTCSTSAARAWAHGRPRRMSTEPLPPPPPPPSLSGGAAPASPAPPRRVTLRALRRKAAAGGPLVVLTAYDYATAAAVSATPGVDVILVGDSAGMVVHGGASTSAVTLEDMLRHCAWVAAGAPRPFLVGDLPFGSYAGPGAAAAVASALRMVREGGMHAVKLEGGGPVAEGKVAAVVAEGVPVMGHVGLLPQTAPAVDGYALAGRSAGAALGVVADALGLAAAGAFSVVLEKVPGELAAAVTALLGPGVPTIGIGAGPECGGQVLVSHDLLGLIDRPPPRFVRQYADLGGAMRAAFGAYAADVGARRFPDPLLPGGGSDGSDGAEAAQAELPVAVAAAPPPPPPPAPASASAATSPPPPRYHFRMPRAELAALISALGGPMDAAEAAGHLAPPTAAEVAAAGPFGPAERTVPVRLRPGVGGVYDVHAGRLSTAVRGLRATYAALYGAPPHPHPHHPHPTA
jgi:3-methyl-2-oxobutanoate hydroxymethyltransferase